MTASDQSGPLDRLIRMAWRRAWTRLAVLAGVVVALAVIGSFLSTEDAQTLVAIAFPFLTFGLFLWIAATYGALSRLRSLRPLDPLLSDSTWDTPRGIVLILRDGMAVNFPSFAGILFCSMFFAVDGAQLRPSVEQALRWTGPRFRRQLSRVAFIRKGRGSPTLRADVEALGSRVGARASYTTIHERVVPSEDPSTPRWVVMVAFLSRTLLGFLPAGRFLGELTEVRALLLRVLAFYRSAGDAESMGRP